MSIEFKVNDRIYEPDIVDSMQFDSNLTLATLLIDDGNKWKITIETQGHVRVFYTPDKKGDPRGRKGQSYRCASDFPPELMDLFKKGKAGDAKNVHVDENNWFEVFVEHDGKFENSYTLETENYEPQSLLDAMWDAYKTCSS